MQTLLTILIVLILLGGGYIYWTQLSGSEILQNTEPGQAAGLQPPPDQNVNINVDVNTAVVKEFAFTSQGFTFTPNSFSVKKGDNVRVVFTNGGGTHDFRIDGYNVGTNITEGGQSQSFEFVADKAGTFEFYCSVGSHRAMGMRGVLTVTE